MPVLALIQRPGHVCYRYRIEAFASGLAARGLYLETLPINQGAFPRILRLLTARRAVILARAARRLVYDFDDAVFQRDSFHPKATESTRLRMRFCATVRAADAVIAGSGYLHQRAATVTRSDKVHTVPTAVEPRLYPTARHRRKGAQAQLVWIGSSSTLPGLKLAEQHLAAAAADYPDMRMRLICDRGRSASAETISVATTASTTALGYNRSRVGAPHPRVDGNSRTLRISHAC